MNIDAAFPSSWLKAADLQGKQVKVIMERIEMQDIGDDHKPVLYFQGKEKGLVLNKTNANNIKDAYGSETSDWFGKPLVIFPTKVDFSGRRVDAIRVRAPDEPETRQAPKQSKQQLSKEDADAQMDDQIPF
jgi:hypothetical protein